ncbi:group II truncated hemoglobin [Ferrigenium sp. UT5]|uniref:group II truncated hemoglobin n=1 Tax=Ferrigenium sp. UT5 TaxID=3242105 RepID=UPI0035506579
MQASENQNTHYQRIGGEAAVRRLVQRFYQLMDELPESHGIRKLHPADLKTSEGKLFMFLSGWMGGPQLFIEKFGHPRLRQRHLPFAIGAAERDQWMLCMTQALHEVVEDAVLRAELQAALGKVADFMRNQAE